MRVSAADALSRIDRDHGVELLKAMAKDPQLDTLCHLLAAKSLGRNGEAIGIRLLEALAGDTQPQRAGPHLRS